MKFSKYIIPLILPLILLATYSDPLVAAETGSITGSVYCDKDENGICDCDDGGLKNIRVQAFAEHCRGTALQTVATDEKGNFTFGNFNPGTYFIAVDLDYVCGGRIPTTSNCQQVTLVNGEVVNVPAFGYSEYGK